MVTISHSLAHVKAHLAELVPEAMIFQLCRDIGHRWRDRLLNPAVTVQLFLLQLLAQVALNGLRHVARLSVTAQALCKAKQRLPLQLLMALVERSVPPGPVASLWKGLTVYLADGMSFLVPDTPALAGKYGKAANQRGRSFGYPVPKLLALMDYSGGFLRKVIPLPSSRQEYTCLSRLFAAVGPNGLLLGDRGLVSFAHLALLLRAGIHGCFRLPRGRVTPRRGGRCRRCLRALGRQDWLVRWTASVRPAWMSARAWERLAGQELVLRQIGYRVSRPGFRTHWAWIVTTLLDPQQYPAEDLIDLYGQRWQIEVYFRDLKRTLGLELLRARSVEGVRKEVLAFVLLYNLIRRVTQQAAAQQGTTADRISFTDALRWLLWSSPGDALPKLKVNRVRKRPAPQRKVKRGRHRFPQLNTPRSQSSKPPCQARL